MKRVLFICFGLMSACAWAANGPSKPFADYQVILDRKPFGVAPPPEVVAPVFTPENSFAKTLRMCALLEDDNGIRIGLIDQSNNKNFFLSVGQTEEGIELVSASYEDEEAVIRKGAEMAVIKLQSGEIQALSPAEQQARLNAPTGRRPSYAERRAMRQQQQQQQQPPPTPKYTGEELRNI